MASNTRALFVHHPRTITDLIIPDSNVVERRFKIVKAIWLSSISYENFITDMLVDRAFLTASPYCHIENDTWYCLFVTKKDAKDGILVMPDRDFVDYAAYLTFDGNLKNLLSLYADPDNYYTRDELEKMSSQELGVLLDEYLYLSYATEAHVNFILLVLDVLEKREKAISPDEVEKRWKAFERQFVYKQEDDEDFDDDLDDFSE